jgi:uncharacterized protein GlcG (DUF336 family)
MSKRTEKKRRELAGRAHERALAGALEELAAEFERWRQGTLVAQGGLGMRTLGLRGATPLEGGLPIVVDSKIVGAIGVSGATAVQDGQVAKAGADAAK